MWLFELLLLSSVMTVTRSQQISWSEVLNYTCSDLLPAIDTFYNISISECQSNCLSLYPMQCTAIVWYEYIKPTGNDVPRCYLFGKGCELTMERTKPVITSFWYDNVSNDINCINYPSNWKDIYFDNCDTYSVYNWCDSAYNSSTTAILSYQDSIYGLDAINVCCDCNGGLFNYDNTYLFEPIWKSTTKLKIYPSDFTCKSIDFSSTLINDIDILQKDRLNLTQFVGLCQYLYSTLYEQYQLLLSINTENNDIIDRTDIYSDFIMFKQYDCINNLYLYNVTICNDTDYNNLYPFIIDIDAQNIYINNHYINTETFIYHLPRTHLQINNYCSFSKLLNTTFPTSAPTKEPTFEPTMNPTSNPSQSPSTHPTLPSLAPTRDPTLSPTTEPTVDPTIDPTIDPSTFPTTGPTKNPSLSPTMEPSMTRRMLLSEVDAYFKTNIMATVLCEISYTKEPTKYPTKYPTADPIQFEYTSTEIDYLVSVTDSLDENISDSNSSIDTKVDVIIGATVGSICFCCCIIGGLVYYFITKRSNREHTTDDGKIISCSCCVRKTNDVPEPSAPHLSDVEVAEIVNRVKKKYRSSSYNDEKQEERKQEETREEAPKDYLCPIGFELMKDPVMVKQSGWTYEREAIEKWIEENGNDPNTRNECSVSDLIPNRTLRDAITRWKENVGYNEQD